MKKTTEQIGKTVEEAIRKGLEELKVARDDVKIDILEEAVAGGILGMLSQKPAKVRLTVDKKLTDEVINATKTKIETMLNDIFKITKEDNVEIEIIGDRKQVIVRLKLEDPKHLIGYKGKTIEALQSLINSMLQREDEEYSKVFLEINNYKEEKEMKLKSYATKMANNVVKFKKPIKLNPMSAYERLIIHQELADRTDIITESYGEEPRRYVVIKKRYNR